MGGGLVLLLISPSPHASFTAISGGRSLVSDPADLRHAGITDYVVLSAAFARPHRLPAEHEGVTRRAACAKELVLMGSEPKPVATSPRMRLGLPATERPLIIAKTGLEGG
jgi:hypothetical protein